MSLSRIIIIIITIVDEQYQRERAYRTRAYRRKKKPFLIQSKRLFSFFQSGCARGGLVPVRARVMYAASC